MFSLVSYQTSKSIKIHPERITKVDKKTVNDLDYEGIKFSNTISLSRHEQVCLMRLRFERYFSHHRAIASLNILVHDVINLLYYEH